MLAKKIAIDLGTTNSIVYVAGKGIVLREPTVVAISSETQEIMALGDQARDMLGKTPEDIVVVRPLKNGVVADYVLTEALLKYFVGKVIGRSRLIKPDIVISIPVGATSVEARAVLDAAYSAGARKAYLIPEPLAAAIGAGFPVAEPSGNMIVNIGGGTTEIAVVSYSITENVPDMISFFVEYLDSQPLGGRHINITRTIHSHTICTTHNAPIVNILLGKLVFGKIPAI